jgi:hypothetical protein
LGNVRRHFCFVGRQDRASSDTLTLQRHLGLPLTALSVENVTDSINHREVSESIGIDWDRIVARNHPDIALYLRLEQEGLISRILDQ